LVLAAAKGKDIKPDSTLLFHTDAGRAVYGGGGIRPDLYVVGDTFTTAERTFIRALGDKTPLYQDAVTSYALQLKDLHGLTSADFPVTGRMIDEVIQRMRAKGIAIPDSILSGARELIGQGLGYEATRYSFGRPAELRRRLGDDLQVKRALSLADRAKSPQDLLTLASPQRPTLPPERNR
jgi:carboxyl-terminal processing protease